MGGGRRMPLAPFPFRAEKEPTVLTIHHPMLLQLRYFLTRLAVVLHIDDDSESVFDWRYLDDNSASLTRDAFDKEVSTRLGKGKFALLYALFFLQNRLGQRQILLWDIIQSETWSAHFLQLIKLGARVNTLRAKWQIEEMKLAYDEFRKWAMTEPESGEAPAVLSAAKEMHIQLTGPALHKRTLAEDLRAMVAEATGDAALTRLQMEQLLAQVLAVDLKSQKVEVFTSRLHGMIMLTRLLAIRHAQSFIGSKRSNLYVTKHMQAHLREHGQQLVVALLNFAVTGCPCEF